METFDISPAPSPEPFQTSRQRSTISPILLVKRGLKNFMKIKDFYIAILIPLVFLPIIIVHGSQEMKCAYVCLVTICFLITQALPLALASLLPALLFPLFGILTVKDVSSKYFQDPVLLFFASVVLAKGIQSVNLHKRIALTLLMHSGSKPIWMVFGFMFSTFFLSIWINNSATAVLMTPVATGVMEEYYRHKLSTASNSTTQTIIVESKHKEFNEEKNEQSVVILTDLPTEKEKYGSTQFINKLEEEDDDNDDSLENLRKCIFIGIAYACNIGGTASLTGTPPNLILSGFLNVLFGPKAEISFMTWLLYSFPGALVIIILTWLLLCIYFLGLRHTWLQFTGKCVVDDPTATIKEQLRKIGKFKQSEITMTFLFLTLIVLWIFKNPQFIPGWQIFFKTGYVSDATPALFIALLLFLTPQDFRSVLLIKDQNGEIPEYKPILEWEKVYRNLLWDINLLFGGGLALATGFKASGLSVLMIHSFRIFRQIPTRLLVLIFSGITSLLTEVLNNIATASILLPIIADIAVSVKVNPLYLLFPSTLAASYCFMLPIGTAPNAIIYSAGKLKFFEMVKPGIMVHLVCLFVTYFFINTYGIWVLGINKFPAWAMPANTTTTAIMS